MAIALFSFYFFYIEKKMLSFERPYLDAVFSSNNYLHEEAVNQKYQESTKKIYKINKQSVSKNCINTRH